MRRDRMKFNNNNKFVVSIPDFQSQTNLYMKCLSNTNKIDAISIASILINDEQQQQQQQTKIPHLKFLTLYSCSFWMKTWCYSWRTCFIYLIHGLENHQREYLSMDEVCVFVWNIGLMLLMLFVYHREKRKK